MLQSIYKSILKNKFTSKGQDEVNNKRLGVKKTFTDTKGRYIEIYTESWGYSVFIYGDGFMNSYYPYCYSVTDEKEAIELESFMQKKMKS